VLLVEGPATAPDTLPGGFHLRNALDALADAAGQPLRVTNVSSAAVRPGEFRDADVVFLAGGPQFADDAPATPEWRAPGRAGVGEGVEGGAGVAICLGGAGKPAFLNERLFKPLEPSAGLLPARVRPAGGDDPLAPLTSVQWSHPLLAGLADPVVGDLGQVRFNRWYELTREPVDR